MKRMLMGICLAICLVCGVVEARADCSGIDDLYLKAKCEVEGQKASGLIGGGILAPNMTRVPQYSGTPGCVTAGCSGAAEEKYYDDPGSLSAAGGTAAGSDERYTQIRQSRVDRDGWDLRTSGAVTTAQSAAETLPPDSIPCGSQDSSVPFCVDTNTPPNENLALAATWLSMTKNVEEDWDPDRLRIFTGKRSTCDFSTIGRSLINCCDSDPDKLIGKCSEEEIALARDKQDWKAHLIGTHCVDKGPFGVCIRKEEVYCTMKSELGRMVQEQGRAQLGMTWGSADTPQCDGFTVDQFSALTFQAMDFTEWYKNVSANIDPAVITKEMATKICTYTGTC